jgi:hypothetical protein
MPETESVELVVGGERIQLRKADVLSAVRDGPLGVVRQHAVEIEQRLYPVKEVFARATRIHVLDFNTTQARAALRRLGFEVRTVSPLGHRRRISRPPHTALSASARETRAAALSSQGPPCSSARIRVTGVERATAPITQPSPTAAAAQAVPMAHSSWSMIKPSASSSSSSRISRLGSVV